MREPSHPLISTDINEKHMEACVENQLKQQDQNESLNMKRACAKISASNRPSATFMGV